MHRPNITAEMVIDVDVGYHWTVRRHLLPDIDPRLSPRELEIVRMMGLRLTNRAIASALEISPWVVSTYLWRVFSKLDANYRATMVAQAIGLGVFTGLDDTDAGTPFM